MTNLWIDVADYCGTDLSSRTCANALRTEVVNAVSNDGAHVVLDFGNVRTVSESYADELLGILVLQRGREWFKRHVTVQRLGKANLPIVAEAIAARLNGHELQPA